MEHLAKNNEDNKGRMIENVVLIGAPIGTTHSSWIKARKQICGRMVNCFSKKDWFLALLYRKESWDIGVAGLQVLQYINQNTKKNTFDSILQLILQPIVLLPEQTSKSLHQQINLAETVSKSYICAGRSKIHNGSNTGEITSGILI